MTPPEIALSEPAKLTLFVDFRIGDTVYLKCGDRPGMVTRFTVNPSESITYEVSWGNASCSWHYGFELSTEKLLTITRAEETQ